MISIAEICALIIVILAVCDGYRVGFIKTVFSIVKISIGAVIGVICSYAMQQKMPDAVEKILIFIFLAVFGGVFGLLSIIAKVLNIVDKVPVAKQINRITGAVVGILKGLVVIWLMIWIIDFFTDVSWLVVVREKLYESELLLSLNKYNPLFYFFK